MSIRGVIFDLDGTLVDSRLDFELMRREMELPDGLPLLDAIESLPPAAARRCWDILKGHERRGAERATLFPGVKDFLATITERGLTRAIVTRNSRASTAATLERLALEFHPIICREDGPVKPDPGAIWTICDAWKLSPCECVMIGDYHFDIEAGRRAGTHTILFTGHGEHREHEGEPADFVLESFAEPARLWAWWAEIDLGGSGGSC